MMKPLDERNREIRAMRQASLTRNKINVGDFVTFACGTTRRVSYVIDYQDDDIHVQTSDSGSFYLGDGYVSFSGSLKRSVPFSTLTNTGDKHDGAVWFFDHDHHRAHGGIDTMIKFSIWRCSQEAPE